MKDILYNQHREALIEGSHFVDGQVRGLLIQDAIDRHCELTRKHMKGFAEWVFVEGWEWEGYNSGWHSDNEPDEAFTTDQLIDKYFESLNKQEHGKI